MLTQEIDLADPLVDVGDKLPLLPASGSQIVAGPPVTQDGPVPCGFRLAVHSARAGEHSKSYTTKTVIEDTERSDDGKVYTERDSVDREEETD